MFLAASNTKGSLLLLRMMRLLKHKLSSPPRTSNATMLTTPAQRVLNCLLMSIVLMKLVSARPTDDLQGSNDISSDQERRVTRQFLIQLRAAAEAEMQQRIAQNDNGAEDDGGELSTELFSKFVARFVLQGTRTSSATHRRLMSVAQYRSVISCIDNILAAVPSSEIDHDASNQNIPGAAAIANSIHTLYSVHKERRNRERHARTQKLMQERG